MTDSLTNRFIKLGPFPGSWQPSQPKLGVEEAFESRLPPAAALPRLPASASPVGAMERLLARRDQTIAPSD
eukprot:2675246-Prymnesium_polylepis.1